MIFGGNRGPKRSYPSMMVHTFPKMMVPLQKVHPTKSNPNKLVPTFPSMVVPLQNVHHTKSNPNKLVPTFPQTTSSSLFIIFILPILT